MKILRRSPTRVVDVQHVVGGVPVSVERNQTLRGLADLKGQRIAVDLEPVRDQGEAQVGRRHRRALVHE